SFTMDTDLKNRWIGTLRARLGIGFDRNLIYLTGGWAGSRVDLTQTWTTPLGGSAGTGSVSSIVNGWVIGGGWQYAWSNAWSIGAEYLYARFGGASLQYT